MEHDLILNGKKNGITEFGEDEGNEDNTIEECNTRNNSKIRFDIGLTIVSDLSLLALLFIVTKLLNWRSDIMQKNITKAISPKTYHQTNNKEDVLQKKNSSRSKCNTQTYI